MIKGKGLNLIRSLFKGTIFKVPKEICKDGEGNHLSLDSFIKQGEVDVYNIFSPTVKQMRDFKFFWRGVVLHEISQGETSAHSSKHALYTYTSGGNVPTYNMKNALVNSGISSDGLLPENCCFFTETIVMTPELQAKAKELYAEFIGEAPSVEVTAGGRAKVTKKSHS